jgi:mRNA interferase RelE/StbE
MLVHSTPSFNKDISKIKDRKLANRIEQILRHMETVKSVADIPGIKRLAGASNAYRVRVGDYRLCFYVIGNSLKLMVFAHRKEVYRYFP